MQARTTSYGLRGVRIITRSGVRVLLDQAAGIVIDLLVALSLFALATAGVMLAASARAEVQRRLKTIGISRAVGASRLHLVSEQARDAAVVAVPAATVGLIAGVLATTGPTDRLLIMLNELPAGAGLVLPLAAGWLVSASIPVLATAWPAWRAASRPPVDLLQGAGIDAGRRRRLRTWRRAGLTALGARLVVARRGRLAATVLTLGASTAFVLLLLALASALSALETDPSALGKRYQLTASLPADAVSRVRAIPGVQAAAPRYEVQAVDSFSLGETIDVIAYPGNHTTFEAPPLTSGRRLRGERSRPRSERDSPTPSASARARRSRSHSPPGASFDCGSPAWSARSTTTAASHTYRPHRCSRTTRRRPSRSRSASTPAPIRPR